MVLAEAIGDDRDVSDAFAGLSNECQHAFWKLTARPQDRLVILGSLSDEA